MFLESCSLMTREDKFAGACKVYPSNVVLLFMVIINFIKPVYFDINRVEDCVMGLRCRYGCSFIWHFTSLLNV